MRPVDWIFALVAVTVLAASASYRLYRWRMTRRVILLAEEMAREDAKPRHPAGSVLCCVCRRRPAVRADECGPCFTSGIDLDKRHGRRDEA